MANRINLQTLVLFKHREGDSFTGALKVCVGKLVGYKTVQGGQVWANQFGNLGYEVCLIEYRGEIISNCAPREVRKDTAQNRAIFLTSGYQIEEPQSQGKTPVNVEPHAVRWASRKVRNELDYTRWHYTDNGNFTACERPILLAVATLLPETDDTEKVDCHNCLRKLLRKVKIECPSCGAQHIDEGVWKTRLHKTHLCGRCGHLWRPFDFYTVGV
jgi:predicted RNA-binding Zn-ribbon protein involved in translation (DUF1610 family)